MGYARVNQDPNDAAGQRVALQLLGVDECVLDPQPAPDRLAMTLAHCSAGDELVVTQLSRLAGSLAELRTILLDLASSGIALRIGTAVYDLRRPDQSLTDAVSLMAAFEGDLAVQRAEAERRAARVGRGRRPGRKPKMSPAQETDITRLYEQGFRTVDELAEDYGVGRSTIYRILDRSATDEPAMENMGEDKHVYRR